MPQKPVPPSSNAGTGAVGRSDSSGGEAGPEHAAGPEESRHDYYRPPSFLESLFNALDSMARRLSDFAPMGRGIHNAVRSPGDGLIDWDNVREIAAATLEIQGAGATVIPDYVIEAYQHMFHDSCVQVAGYTDLEVSGLPDRVDVFNQVDWISANVVSFKFLFDPISERYAEMFQEVSGESNPGAGRRTRKFARVMLSMQVGIIMGYLSRNILGQFDLSLPEPEKGGKLYIVEPNVARVDAELGLEPVEFRKWITLHEVTHSFEFHSNTWLRDYLASSIQEYLNNIDWKGMSSPDFFKKMRQRNQRASGDDALKAGGLISVISTPEQREILARLQGVMTLLEGYSNHVMDVVGKRLLPSYDTMKSRFERRRQNKGAAEKLFQRLIGLDLKLRQYTMGEKFVNAVVESEGLEFMNRVWEGPELLPTVQEIDNPAAWIARAKARASTREQ